MKRVLGVKSVVSMSIATMVGSVLVLPGPTVGLTGASACMSVAAASLAVLSGAFDKSEIATAMPVSGGEYVYLAKAFGPLVGTMAGFALWFTLLFKGSFGLAGFSAYLDAMVGGKDTVNPWAVKGMTIGMLLVLLIGNLMGLKKIKTYQKIATLGAMVILTLLSLYSYSEFEPVTFDNHFFTNGAGGFIESVGFVFMGYAGLTKICALASEIKNPEKNMPKAIWISLGFFTPFFVCVIVACLGVIPYTDLTEDYAPMHTLATKVFGKGMGYFIGAICIVAMIAMANIALMAVSRFPYAMALDGLIHPGFAAINKKTDAPYVSLIVSATAMAFAILFLPVKRIAKLCSAVQLILFTLVNVSLIVFRVHDEHWYKPSFRSPCFPYLQIMGITLKIVMLVYIGVEGIIAAIAIFTLGLLLYRFYGYHHAQFIGILRVEKWFGLTPMHLEPVKPHKDRIHRHPETEKDFEKEIWEYEEDHHLPHEPHILQKDKPQYRSTGDLTEGVELTRNLPGGSVQHLRERLSPKDSPKDK